MTRSSHVPGYLRLHRSGELLERAGKLQAIQRKCTICPRECRVDRESGELGACGVDARPKVAAVNLHYWEEPPVSGDGGSGTIFFSGCAMRCLYCQNYPISQLGVGNVMSVDELAGAMLGLQKKGAHNINLVTAAHQTPAVAAALVKAAPLGLRIPIVYNTGGYESLDTLRLLDGIVDIYLPDIKYADADTALRLSRRKDYVERNRAALAEMWRQVGPLKLDENGVAWRGVLIRHLVLPGGLAGTRECLGFIKERMGIDAWVSVMNQYFPAHEAHEAPPLDRKVSEEEYAEACAMLCEIGLENGFVQGMEDDDFPLPERNGAAHR